MTNLLKETLDELKKNGKGTKDVVWVGNFKGEYSSWENFAEVANISYDAGYGGNEIASNLVIVGKDWWLERGEYDGSEWWEFKTKPNRTKKRTIVGVQNVDYRNRVEFK